MGQFNVPSESQKYSSVIETFRGVDLNNSPSNVDKSRSPEAPNMIRDQVGKVRKRMGYTTIATAPNGDPINGRYVFGSEQLIHAGAKLYKLTFSGSTATFTEIGDMANEKSRGFIFDEKLFLLDGTNYKVYNGTTLQNVSAIAYKPMIIISRNPDGGGTSYESLNLIGTGWKESFLGQASVTEYQLTTENLDATAVVAEVMDSNGEWQTKVEGTDFSVNRTTGKVTFSTAPGAPPVTGQDNVRITAYKTREGYADTINKCRAFCIYGVGGSTDRVFLSDNPDKAGMDWYSGFEDPSYFPDTNYTKLSRDGSSITGYAVINNTLATFLNGATDGRNVIVRTGTLDDDGEALFKISNTLIGPNTIARDSFQSYDKEPLFLTDRGVYAITAEELTGQKCSQERSYYILGALQSASGKENADSTRYQDFYVLAIGDRFYFLDMQQKSYEKDSPYSSYQYECYYWTNITARRIWTDGAALCFGTAEGKICRFATNVDNPASYNDDGEPIDAYWETSDLDGKLFFHAKTFIGIAVRLAAAQLTGVKIYAQVRGVWKQVFDAKQKARYFSFEYIDFAKFVFSGDQTPRTMYGKIKLKKVDKARFRLQNNVLNEPFGIYAFGMQWRETGSNYKR